MAGVPLELHDKVVLVTGGSRGIGAETVRLFSRAGGRVAFNYLKAREQAEELVLECNAAECAGPNHPADPYDPNARCAAFQQDLSSPEDGRKLVASAVAAFGRLDAL